MLTFLNWYSSLDEATISKIGEWQVVKSAHLFDRLSQRGNFDESDVETAMKNIVAKSGGLRFGEYGFQSKALNRIFICEVEPTAKKIKVITVLLATMKLKHGTSKIMTESVEIILID